MQNEIQRAIQAVLGELGISDVDFVVEHPADLSHGDYATNVAMAVFSKPKKENREFMEDVVQRAVSREEHSTKFSSFIDGKMVTNPRQVAEKFKEKIEGKISQVTRIEVAGPGFINFTLDHDFFREKITGILAHPETWGRNDSWVGKKVLVEYTDPNPFKEFHIGHIFANTVGESIARLFMMNGAETKRLNYQGDVGLHVAHALWGMKELGISADSPFTARDLGRAYAHGATAYKSEDPRAVQEIRDINKAVYERSDAGINALYDAGRKVSLEFFEEVYTVLDTQFDAYFFESEAGPKGKELVLENPDVFPESDGARIFEGEKYGLHTRVFLNKEGLPTYEAKELALAKLKEERLGAYDHSVISTANEVSEYFKVLKKAMSFVYPELAEKTEHIGHGTVRLSTGKMSSRTGDVIPALDFIDEVADAAAAKMDEGGKTAPTEELARDIAIGAIRYATLHGSIFQNSVFDKDKALSFEGDSGPYLQYTHARIVSVLEKAKMAGVIPATQVGPVEAYPVEKLLYQFEEVVAKALRERAPHTVAVYLTELAGAFNAFYSAEKIADAGDQYAPYKAGIAEAVRITLKNGLWVLGIKAPNKM